MTSETNIQPCAGKSLVEILEQLENPQSTMTISRFIVFSFRFLIGFPAGTFFISIGMYKSLLPKLKPQS